MHGFAPLVLGFLFWWRVGVRQWLYFLAAASFLYFSTWVRYWWRLEIWVICHVLSSSWRIFRSRMKSLLVSFSVIFMPRMAVWPSCLVYSMPLRVVVFRFVLPTIAWVSKFCVVFSWVVCVLSQLPFWT